MRGVKPPRSYNLRTRQLQNCDHHDERDMMGPELATMVVWKLLFVFVQYNTINAILQYKQYSAIQYYTIRTLANATGTRYQLVYAAGQSTYHAFSAANTLPRNHWLRLPNGDTGQIAASQATACLSRCPQISSETG